MSKRRNSAYRRLQQSFSDSLANKCVVYCTIKHKLHNKPLEEVVMHWPDVCKLLADFDKAVDKESLVKEEYLTFPIVRGTHRGFISVALHKD